ncbi:MAG: PDZ domain-containing protein [Candidatus Heimdallarchaeota archaeon]|nr:PDZ domain-containing protein [Candidatus Heimdallarchaeota archaeon]
MSVHYKLIDLNTENHLISITMSFEAPWDDPVLVLPSWAPGSYLIRDYSRNIQDLSGNLATGKKLQVNKLSKNKWILKGIKKGNNIIINYRVYAYEFSVRTSYLDETIGLLNPITAFMYITDNEHTQDSKQISCNLEIDINKKWNIITALNKSALNNYHCDNYDMLVDSPIGFAIDKTLIEADYHILNNNKSVPCKLAIIGENVSVNTEQLIEDLKLIQKQSIEMFGELPYDKYVWLLYVTENRGGGLEHLFSNCSIISRWFLNGKRENYIRVLSLESHEHFHVYNVKRIRPKQFGPFNYISEVYSKILWFSEGITSYYTDLNLVRSGLITLDEYTEKLTKDIKLYESIHGRKVLSVSESSYDAWIRLYKPDENTNNSSISYYLKGKLIGLILDIEIRKQSNWKYSLDTVFRYLYERYKEDPINGFNENALQSIIETNTNTNLDDFWEKFIDGTTEIEFNPFFNEIGLTITSTPKEDKPYLGINFQEGTLKINSIDYNSPGTEANLSVGDELIAIGNYKISSSNFNEKLLYFYLNKLPIMIKYFHDDVLNETEIKNLSMKELEYKIELQDENVLNREQFFWLMPRV